MQVEPSSFLIVNLPFEFGSKFVLNRSNRWYFWCHCFAWSCMHHPTMPCKCFACWCAELIPSLNWPMHHPWLFRAFYLLHLPVFGNFGLVRIIFSSLIQRGSCGTLLKRHWRKNAEICRAGVKYLEAIIKLHYHLKTLSTSLEEVWTSWVHLPSANKHSTML